MPGYVIANVDVIDADGFAEYRKMVEVTVAQYGGKYLVRGGGFDQVEGEWNPHRLVVLEFQNIERAREWYHSTEYAPAKALRQKCAQSNVLIVEGVNL